MGTPEDILNQISDGIDGLRNLLDHLSTAQSEDSDEGNEDKIEHAHRALDDFAGTIEDIVP